MPNYRTTPLHKDEDFTINPGESTVVFLSTPEVSTMRVVNYSYQNLTDNDRNLHTHDWIQKDDWDGIATNLPLNFPWYGGEMKVFGTFGLDVPLWVGRDKTSPSARTIQRMSLDYLTGLFLSNETAELPITTTGGTMSCMGAHPTDKRIVYTGVTDGATLELWRCADDTTPVKVWNTVVPYASADITSIRVQSNGTTWFTVGSRANISIPSTIDESYWGLYKAADGITFARVSAGHLGDYIKESVNFHRMAAYCGGGTTTMGWPGLHGVAVDEATGRVWTTHCWASTQLAGSCADFNTDTGNLMCQKVSYSDDGGLTWTGAGIQVEATQGSGFNWPFWNWLQLVGGEIVWGYQILSNREVVVQRLDKTTGASIQVLTTPPLLGENGTGGTFPLSAPLHGAFPVAGGILNRGWETTDGYVTMPVTLGSWGAGSASTSRFPHHSFHDTLGWGVWVEKLAGADKLRITIDNGDTWASLAVGGATIHPMAVAFVREVGGV